MAEDELVRENKKMPRKENAFVRSHIDPVTSRISSLILKRIKKREEIVIEKNKEKKREEIVIEKNKEKRRDCDFFKEFVSSHAELIYLLLYHRK